MEIISKPTENSREIVMSDDKKEMAKISENYFSSPLEKRRKILQGIKTWVNLEEESLRNQS